jgi:hypothetical protein
LNHSDTSYTPDVPELVQQPRLWQDNGWTARVLKNEDDDGWAVAMIKDGEPEPALIAFNTLVKTASEFVRRQEQQLHASLHQSITVTAGAARVTVSLDIVPDEDNPYGTLSAHDDAGELLAEVRVAASFKLSRSSAIAWADKQFKKPG